MWRSHVTSSYILRHSPCDLCLQHTLWNNTNTRTYRSSKVLRNELKFAEWERREMAYCETLISTINSLGKLKARTQMQHNRARLEVSGIINYIFCAVTISVLLPRQLHKWKNVFQRWNSGDVGSRKFRWRDCFKSATERLLLLYFAALRSSWAAKLHAVPLLATPLRSAQQEQGKVNSQNLLTFSYVSSWEEQKNQKAQLCLAGSIEGTIAALTTCCCRPHWRAFSVHRGYEWHLTCFQLCTHWPTEWLSRSCWAGSSPLDGFAFALAVGPFCCTQKLFRLVTTPRVGGVWVVVLCAIVGTVQ